MFECKGLLIIVREADVDITFRMYDTQGPFVSTNPPEDSYYYTRTPLGVRTVNLPMPIRVSEVVPEIKVIMNELNDTLPPNEKYKPGDFFVSIGEIAGLLP